MVVRSCIDGIKLIQILVSVSLATVTVDIRDRLLGLGQDMQTFTKLIAGYTVHTQESVLLEDALGYSLRMPLDIVRSWHVCFHFILLLFYY
jgi:uncharacterized transporter YbjL